MPTSVQREGFTLDNVGQIARRSVLNPYLTGAVASALFAWDLLRQRGGPVAASLPALPSNWGPGSLARSRVWKFFLAGLVLSIHEYLNRWTHNNWVKSKDWSNWDDELVLVTGGSSGIGASMTKRFLAKNPRTRLIVIDYAPLGWQPANDAEKKRLHYYQCDLNDSKQIKTVMRLIREQVGHPTVLINNAGLVRGYTVMEGSFADTECTVRVNLTAPILLMKEVLPNMVATNHGHILSVSSMSSQMPPPKLGDYAATKAGLLAVHEALQLELRRYHKAPNVRLSHALLGFVRTPMVRGDSGQSAFIFPILTPETVSETLVDRIYSGYGGSIYLPETMRYISMARGGPEWFLATLRKGTEKITVDLEGRQMLDEDSGHLSAVEGNLKLEI